MNVLFICKHNCFRSIVAKELFDKFNKNCNIITRASGIIKANFYSRDKQREAIKKFGLKLDKIPENLDQAMLKWADLMIIVGDDVPISLFENIEDIGKLSIRTWPLKDVHHVDLSYNLKTERLTEMIKENVEKLVNELSII